MRRARTTCLFLVVLLGIVTFVSGPAMGATPRVAAGGGVSFALKADGILWAWGNNGYGQIGDGTTTRRFTPVQVGTDRDWTAVAVGYSHTVALKSDGTLWAWGDNDYGQLGDGTTTDRWSPLQVGTDTRWAAVTAGYAHTLALKSDGTLWAWGYNAVSQLGDGTTTDRWSPLQVGTDTRWTAVTAGYAHTLALKSDGTLWAWGANTQGQLGDGTFRPRGTPLQVGTDSRWTAVTAGYEHTVALKPDGSVWAWGNNTYGQIGDGTTVFKGVPVHVGTDTDWTAVAAGYGHTLALKADRSVWAWGNNVGDGTLAESHVPVQVPFLVPPACTYRLSGNPPANASGFTTTFGVFPSDATCTWTLSASDPWITITSGASGTGTATATVSIAANTGKYSRMGSVTVGDQPFPTIRDQSFTISQSGTGVRIGAVVGDFDGDGKPDLLWQHDTTGALQVWTMNGTTRWDVEPLNPGDIIDTSWKIVGVGDFNGDGDPDLLWYYKVNGTIGVWLMNGTILLSAVWTTPGQLTDTNWNIVGVGDFNGDGHPDIVWQHDSGYLGVWLMNGTTMTTAAWLNPSHLTDPSWRVVGVGDFNGDGKPDLLWYHQFGGWLGAWLMDGTNMTTAVWLTPNTVGDKNWRVAGVGDVNGDGKPDILWQHATGSLGAWLMDGTNMTTAQWLTPSSVSDPNWKMVGPK